MHDLSVLARRRGPDEVAGLSRAWTFAHAEAILGSVRHVPGCLWDLAAGGYVYSDIWTDRAGAALLASLALLWFCVVRSTWRLSAARYHHHRGGGGSHW